jgi:hypothetical protein
MTSWPVIRRTFVKNQRAIGLFWDGKGRMVNSRSRG